jgi:hypothetical protein
MGRCKLPRRLVPSERSRALKPLAFSLHLRICCWNPSWTLRRRGITPQIARRGIESSHKLGRHRYVVERSLAWLGGYRRLQVRYERRADILLVLHLACAPICLRFLSRSKG